MAHIYKIALRFGIINYSSFYKFSTSYLLNRTLFTISHISQFKCKRHNNIMEKCKYFKQSNYSMKVENESANELEFSEYDGCLYQCDETENISRSLFYPNSNDIIILGLKKCYNIQDVLNIISDKSLNLNHTHLCQAVLTLYDLQRIFYESYVTNLEKYDVDVNPDDLIHSYINEQNSHQEFQYFLKLVLDHIYDFNVKELSFSLNFLIKLGVPFESILFNKILNVAIDKLKSNPNEWCLESLVKYLHCVKIKDEFGYYSKYAVPLVMDYLNNCNSNEEFKYITLCLMNLNPYISNAILEKYIYKCNELISRKIIFDNSNTILKILTFLTNFRWKNYNTFNTNSISKLLIPTIDKMDIMNIMQLQKIFWNRHEPMFVLNKTKDKVRKCLEEIKSDNKIKSQLLIPDVLYCQITIWPQTNNSIVAKLLNDIVDKSFPSIYPNIYKLIRHIKMPDNRLYDKFWKQVIDDIQSSKDENKVIKYCFKYIHFDNNLEIIYQNEYFESRFLQELLNILEYKGATIELWKFCRILSFIIGYGFKNPVICKNLDIASLFNRLEEISDRITMLNIFSLSRGLQRAIKLIDLNDFPQHDIIHIYRFKKIMDDTIDKHSQNNSLSLIDLNLLLTSYVNYNRFYDTECFLSLLSKYNNINENELSSRSIKDSLFIFFMSNHVVIEFLNKITDYIVKFSDDISGSICQKVLSLYFLFGLTPKNEIFFDVVIKNLFRDLNMLNGLSIIRGCYALNYYGYSPDYFIKYIFSLEFMERLDKEILGCNIKTHYPLLLRKLLMNLNRTVCLEHPEHSVPWFHEKYVQEIMSSTRVQKSFFHQDVYKNLLKIINNENLIQAPHYTHYGYLIDFYFEMNKNKKIKSMISNNHNTTKFAILLSDRNILLKIMDDNSNSQIAKRGIDNIVKRHLELLGYRVIGINKMFWNSMYMNEPNAKVDFLRNEIFNKT